MAELRAGMTWRSFCALLGGLSPTSVLVQVLAQRSQPQGSRDTQVISEPLAAERYFATIGG